MTQLSSQGSISIEKVGGYGDARCYYNYNYEFIRYCCDIHVYANKHNNAFTNIATPKNPPAIENSEGDVA